MSSSPLHRVAVLAALIGATAAGAPALAAPPVSKAQAAETERIKALEAKLEQSLALIQQLSQRVQELEKKPTAAAALAPKPVVAAAPMPDPRVEALEDNVKTLQAAAAVVATKTSDLGLPIHGFADVSYAQHSKTTADRRSGTQLGNFDLYLTPQFGGNVRSLLELTFEFNAEGSLGTDLERIQLGYAVNDNLVLWAGRFHTPYGYWNTAFHHGAQIQTSITRPRFLQFEDVGGILPAHAVGFWATGKTPTSLGKLTYDAYVANGNRIANGTSDYQASGDDNKKPLIGFNLGFSPNAVPGLTVGLHGLQQQVGGNNADDSRSGVARTQMLGGYFAVDADNYELLGEFYQFNNRDLGVGGASHRSRAAYVQGGYSFWAGTMAYARYEKASLNGLDPYFYLQNSGVSYSQNTAGLRIDVDPRAALKFEWARVKDAGAQSFSTLRAQYSIRF